MITLDTPLDRIHGFGLRFLAQLKKLHIHTVRELLWHFPSRYEDFSQIYTIADLEPGQQATIQGVIQDISVRRSWQKHIIIVEAKVADETGEIRAVWFNQPYIKNILRPGRQANLSGKVAFTDGELYLTHPTYELVGQNETRHTARLVPIYPETRGLTSKGIRFFVQPILKNIDPVPEWLPPETRRANDLPDLHQALQDIHFPQTIEGAESAKRRFVFEELFLLQIANLVQKGLLAKEKAPVLPVELPQLKEIIAELPFPLTHSQKQSLWEIVQDLAKPTPMNRLLQGDVGSGKTVVAAIAAIVTALHDHQAAFMAPTEVLARQHYGTLKRLLKTVRSADQPVIALLTAQEAKVFYENDLETTFKKAELIRKIERGDIGIVIGTHTLITGSKKKEGIAFKNLGLVIIDEQHRFGVDQRARLSSGGARKKKDAPLPHFLSMSATPIPRTLMLTIFGDLDISTITELPAGRKNIITEIVSPEEREKTYAFIRSEVKRGRQAFVVCPRIEKADAEHASPLHLLTMDARSVTEEYERLTTKIFPDLTVGMLHGQLPAKGKSTAAHPTKENVMRDFQEGRIDILVSTSVIEVGVDIPNASIMMIEGSDRFGLAQLYQFRGRVGRGEHQSYCFLFTDSSGKTVRERLKAILEAKNGFELAERDLQIRGPGELIGQKQTGLPDVLMNGLQDIELIKRARAAALTTLQKNPTLSNHPALKERLEAFRRAIHLE